MRAVTVIAVAAFCVSCGNAPLKHTAVASEPKPLGELVFRGTVVSVTGPIADMEQPWVVTTRVDRVLSGSFARKQFQFAVHSAAGILQVGEQYTIRAVRTKGGYTVDELQWAPGAPGGAL